MMLTGYEECKGMCRILKYCSFIPESFKELIIFILKLWRCEDGHFEKKAFLFLYINYFIVNICKTKLNLWQNLLCFFPIEG